MSYVYLTPKEVSERYGIAVGTLANRRALGLGPAYRALPNRLIRYRLDEIEAWIESGYGEAAA